MSAVANTMDLVRSEIEKVKSQVANQLISSLRISTPKDTGRASRGWKIFTEDFNKTVIGNSVPYITELNYGKSLQAPAYFVQRTVAVVVRKFNES